MLPKKLIDILISIELKQPSLTSVSVEIHDLVLQTELVRLCCTFSLPMDTYGIHLSINACILSPLLGLRSQPDLKSITSNKSDA